MTFLQCCYEISGSLIRFYILLHISLQTINYVPRVEDDGKTLRCVYEQFDSEGNSLFPGNQKDMDEVELSVDFLEKPLEDALPIERSAQVKKATPMRFI